MNEAKRARDAEKSKRAAISEAENKSADAYRNGLRKNSTRSTQTTAATGGSGSFDAALKSLTGQ